MSALAMDDLLKPVVAVLLRLAEPDPEQGLRILEFVGSRCSADLSV